VVKLVLPEEFDNPFLGGAAQPLSTAIFAVSTDPSQTVHILQKIAT
jgi:hypothetical protein